jgi:hypothetical protein
MNILPQEGSFGQTLGAGLGNVLGSGLQALAEHKMQQIAQGKLQNALSGLGIQNPQQVSQMPLEALKPLIEARSKNLYPSGRYEGGVDDLASDLARQRLEQGERRLSLNEELARQRLEQGGKRIESSETLAKQRLAQNERRLGLSEKKLGLEEEKPAIKDAQKFATSLQDEVRGGHRTRARMGKILKLGQTGKINSPLIVTALDAFKDKFGLDATGLLTPETQELQKVIAEQITGLKAIFPRATNLDLQAFMRSVPSLVQSQAGRERVAGDILQLLEMPEREFAILRDIKRANGGKLPVDVRDQIEERMAPEWDKFEERFNGTAQQVAQPSQTFSDLPPAAQFKGRKIQDDKTGQIFVSDGTSWRKA